MKQETLVVHKIIEIDYEVKGWGDMGVVYKQYDARPEGYYCTCWIQKDAFSGIRGDIFGPSLDKEKLGEDALESLKKYVNLEFKEEQS